MPRNTFEAQVILGWLAQVLGDFLQTGAMPAATYDPTDTRKGRLPPWELAKARGLKEAWLAIEKATDKPMHVLMGQTMKQFIASRVTVKGGGRPTERGIMKALDRAGDPTWYPGKPPETHGGPIR